VTGFAFDPVRHEYTDRVTGQVYPHVTGLLQSAGLIDPEWFTDEGRARGTWIHDRTAAYDRGSLVVEDLPEDEPYRGYTLAHVSAMAMIPHEFEAIEVPRVHPGYRFGGRPDRAGTVYGLRAVLEVKSGSQDRSHEVQLALQAILEADRWGLKPERVARFCLYLKPTGNYRMVEFTRVRDFDSAYRIIRTYCQ
jgi:hypothetical protein